MRWRWRIRDGCEYAGTPAEVVTWMRELAYGYAPGPGGPLAPYALWVAERVGMRLEGVHPGTGDAEVAERLLAALELAGYAVRVEARVLPFRRP